MRRVYFFLATLTVCVAVIFLPTERPHPALREVTTVPARMQTPGYQREAFGRGWRATATAGCTTREVVLAHALDPSNPYPSGCTRSAGSFPDPYTGAELSISPGTRSEVDIDHVFPLAAAWDLGAHAWSTRQRIDFANDPLNLVAVSRTANQDKSDQLPSQWLPPKREHRCWYAGRLAQVAVKYALPLPQEDLAVMQRQCLPAPWR